MWLTFLACDKSALINHLSTIVVPRGVLQGLTDLLWVTVSDARLQNVLYACSFHNCSVSAVNPTPLVIHLSSTHSIYSEFRSHSRTETFHNLVLGPHSFFRRLRSSENLMHFSWTHCHRIEWNARVELGSCSQKRLSGFVFWVVVFFCIAAFKPATVTNSCVLRFLTYWLSANWCLVKRKCHLSGRERALICILFLGCEAHTRLQKHSFMTEFWCHSCVTWRQIFVY